MWRYLRRWGTCAVRSPTGTVPSPSQELLLKGESATLSEYQAYGLLMTTYPDAFSNTIEAPATGANVQCRWSVN